MSEYRHTAPLALTFDEEDVLRDTLGSTPLDDEEVIPAYRNALHTLRMKTSLHYSAARGVDVDEAVLAAEEIADYAREHGLVLRLYYDHNRMAYDLHLGDRSWDGETLWFFLPRVARDLQSTCLSEVGAVSGPEPKAAASNPDGVGRVAGEEGGA